jgi:hypothetical protein
MATKGQVTQTMAGVDDVEIKATIPDHQIDEALRSYNLKKDNNERYIYFFDTPDLKLFEVGVIGRARRVVGGKHDSTIKFRPVDPAAVPPLWKNHAGFKIEADVSEKGMVKSASLTKPIEKGVIKRVEAGKEPIATLFGEEQQLFLLSMAKHQLDFTNIVVLGPVQAWRWKFTDPGLPWALTTELWQRNDNARLLEVSIKVPLVQAAAARAAFVAFMAEVGADHDDGQQAKTRWTLEHYSRQPRGSAAK